MIMLTTFQTERLCIIVYLDILIKMKDKTLSYIMDYMLKEGFDNEPEPPILMTRAEWENVANSVLEDSKLGSLSVVKFVNDEKTGHRAFYFSDNTENSDIAYVIFRGTSSDYEWLDNGEGMFVSDTPMQKAALDFVIQVKEMPNVNYIYTAGHSKGGNKAQYCAIAGGNIVNQCVSVDGQGFSGLFFEKYNDSIEFYKPRITAIAERRDFVNCLGFYLKKPDYYSGGRCLPSEEFPHGDPLPYFHCPDALRLSCGMTGNPAPVSYISEVINYFVIYYLTEKKYERKREKTIIGLVSLMTEGRGGKNGIKAMSEAVLAFLELASKDENFRKKLMDVFINEKDVIAATTLMIKQNKMESGILTDKAIKELAEKLILHPVHFSCFIKCAERFALFTHRTRKVKEQAENINHFIKKIFKQIEKAKLKNHASL
jgi:hypothetical protein